MSYMPCIHYLKPGEMAASTAGGHWHSETAWLTLGKHIEDDDPLASIDGENLEMDAVVIDNE